MDNIKYYFKLYFSITNTIIIINVILFIITTLISLFRGSTLSTDAEVAVYFGANYYVAIYNGQIFRLLSYAFLHGSILHILFNMMALKDVGQFIENFYGRRKFFAIYILTALIGGITSFIFSKGLSIGASGAVFGLLGILLAQRFRKNIYTPELPINFTMLVPMILFNLILGFSVSGIDNAAHLGGLASGFILGLIVEPEVNFNPSKFLPLLDKVLFIGSIFISIYTFIFWILNFFQH